MTPAAKAEFQKMHGMLGSRPYSELQEQGLCWSCRNSAANREYHPATQERIGPELQCLRERDARPMRTGEVPGVVKCSGYCYEPGAAG